MKGYWWLAWDTPKLRVPANHLKMDGWNQMSFLELGACSEETLSFREGISDVV